VPEISTGLDVELQFPSAPGWLRQGKVDYVYPTIDPKTRTSRVRIIVSNEDGVLRPGAFADVRFKVAPSEKLSVPSEAVLRDGRGSHVIASLGEGRFAARQVATGISSGGRTEILGGLELGERVVASGQFLLDSEANLREGFSKYASEAFGPDTPLSALPLDAEALTLFDHFVDAALYFHEALRDRYDIDPYFLDPAIKAGETLKARFPETKLISIVNGAQKELTAAKDAKGGDALGEQLAALMKALEPWLMNGAPAHYRNLGLSLYRDAASDRLWIEEGDAARNPYGTAEAMLVDWPDLMEGMPATADRPETDPHAGHR
jgi:Cu(I)/Ag(I) efflux system membrane fusion protein